MKNALVVVFATRAYEARPPRFPTRGLRFYTSLWDDTITGGQHLRCESKVVPKDSTKGALWRPSMTTNAPQRTSLLYRATCSLTGARPRLLALHGVSSMITSVIQNRFTCWGRVC